MNKKMIKLAKKYNQIDLCLQNYERLISTTFKQTLRDFKGNLLMDNDLQADDEVVENFQNMIEQALFTKQEIFFRNFKIVWDKIENHYFPLLNFDLNYNSYTSSLYLTYEKYEDKMQKIVQTFEMYLEKIFRMHQLFEIIPGIIIFNDEQNNFKLFYDERILDIHEGK